jgi:hypothetical protein
MGTKSPFYAQKPLYLYLLSMNEKMIWAIYPRTVSAWWSRCTPEIQTPNSCWANNHQQLSYILPPDSESHMERPGRTISIVKTFKKNSVALVRKQTIPTDRPPFVSEVSANYLLIESVTWSAQRITSFLTGKFLLSHHKSYYWEHVLLFKHSYLA